MLDFIDGDNLLFDFVVVLGGNFVMGLIFFDVIVGLDGLVVVFLGSVLFG